MFDYNIYIRQMGETTSIGERVSAKSTSNNVQQRLSQNTAGNQVSKVVKDSSSGITIPKASVGLAMAKKAAEIAEQAIDYSISSRYARTGDSIGYHNTQAAKSMFKSFGKDYITGQINHFISTRHIIRRQNIQNEIQREVYNLNVYGDKFKSK